MHHVTSREQALTSIRHALERIRHLDPPLKLSAFLRTLSVTGHDLTSINALMEGLDPYIDLHMGTRELRLAPEYQGVPLEELAVMVWHGILRNDTAESLAEAAAGGASRHQPGQ
jgi:hypothetical protein